MSIDEMKALTVEDVKPLYKKNYWDRVRGDDLPAGVDYAVFDVAVNSGDFKEAEIFGPDCPDCGHYMNPVMVDTDGTNLEEGYECPDCGYPHDKK